MHFRIASGWQPDLDVEAVLGSDLDRTHLTAVGAFELDMKALGKRSGASLAKVEVDGELRLDGSGVHLSGTTKQSRSPPIVCAPR